MIGLPRFTRNTLKILTLTSVVAVQSALYTPSSAQPAAPAPMVAATTAPSPELKDAVENFWYYGKVGKYDLAAAMGEKIVSSGADPQAVLIAFEQVVAARPQEEMDTFLNRWHELEPMRDITSKVMDVIGQGYRARRSSPEFIQQQLSRLTLGERPYSLAITRLRESGELAVPFMIDILRDPTQKDKIPVVRRAMRDLARLALNPLVAATEMKDWDTLNVILGALGDMGYDSAAPYVMRVIESADAPISTKGAAAEALAKLGVARSGGTASDMFFMLGQKFYDGQSSITADVRYPLANIWSWDGQASTLTRKQVPHEIFNDIMAMRASEYTLSLGGARADDAVSLWLAANFKREADLPEGQTDATRQENNPQGHYYGVAAGARYLNAALDRALRDHNAPVAFKAIRSLQEIVGQSNLFLDQSSRPLINAMQYPDRKVRFEAAFALAAALPQTKFEGQQRVVPLLAEAISQTGQPSVLVVMNSQADVSKLVDDLKKEKLTATGATTAAGAVTTAASLPAVDVILVSEDIGPGNVDGLFAMAANDVRLAGAARLVMTRTNASPWESQKTLNSLLSTTTATDAAALKPAIEEARTKAGALSLDGDIATQYATRAGELLIKVGISRGQVYDLGPAKGALLLALNDARPEIVKLAGQVLGLLNDRDAQSGLLSSASEEKTADDVKISLYKSLATNAKFFGNRLDAGQLATLEKTVAEATNLEVRAAAAEARGALNLPADQAKSLIVKQTSR